MTLSASTDSRQRTVPAIASAIGPAITKPNMAGKSPRCWAFRASPRSNTQGSVRAAAWLKASAVAASGRWPAAEAVRGAPGRAANWLRHGQRAPKNRVSQPGGAVRA